MFCSFFSDMNSFPWVNLMHKSWKQIVSVLYREHNQGISMLLNLILGFHEEIEIIWISILPFTFLAYNCTWHRDTSFLLNICVTGIHKLWQTILVVLLCQCSVYKYIVNIINPLTPARPCDFVLSCKLGISSLLKTCMCTASTTCIYTASTASMCMYLRTTRRQHVCALLVQLVEPVRVFFRDMNSFPCYLISWYVACFYHVSECVFIFYHVLSSFTMFVLST